MVVTGFIFHAILDYTKFIAKKYGIIAYYVDTRSFIPGLEKDNNYATKKYMTVPALATRPFATYGSIFVE